MKVYRLLTLALVVMLLAVALGQSAVVGAQPGPSAATPSQTGSGTHKGGVAPSAPNNPTSCSQAPWITKSPIPLTEGYDSAAVTSNGTVAYSAGGYNSLSDSALNQFSAYNPATDAWTALAPMSDTNYEATAAYDPSGNKVYVFGGSYGTTISNKTRIYDVASNSWSYGTPLPDVSAWMAGGYNSANGKIYLVGGYVGYPGAIQSQIWVYNISSATFITITNANTPALDSAASAMINGHLYLAGGQNTGGSVNTLWDYNIAANTWTHLPNLPLAIHGAAAANVNGQLWVYGGGYTGGGSDNGKHTYIYDPASNLVTTGPSLNSPHYDTAGTSVGQYAVVIGGSDAVGGLSTNVTEVSTNPPSSCPSPTVTVTVTASPTTTPSPSPCGQAAWIIKSPIPSPVDGYLEAGVTSDGTVAYSAGGHSTQSSIQAQFSKYNPATDIWSELAPMSDANSNATAAFDPGGHKVYVFGGNYSGNAAYTRIYDVASNSWSYGTPLPDTRSGMAGGYNSADSKIYLVGGYGGSPSAYQNQIWVYNISSASFITLTNANTPALWDSGSAMINGHLYVAGGRDINGSVNTLWDYNIAANTWTQLPNLPQAIHGAAAANVNGRLWIYGGGDFGGSGNNGMNTYIYDPTTNLVTTGPSLNSPHFYTAGTSVGQYVVVIGGMSTPMGNSSTNVTEVSTNPPSACASPTPGGPTATPGTVPFTDISGDLFIHAIEQLYYHGVVNGTDATHFTPHGTSTRGQFAKVVTLAFGLASYTPAVSDFSDVPASYFAYAFIESGFHAGILSGFDANSCAAHRVAYPCYLPNVPITRGQLTKLVVNAARYPLFTPTGGGQSFTDVPPSNVFFASIETAHNKGVINGYPGGVFLPNQNISRDQMCQIVYTASITP